MEKIKQEKLAIKPQIDGVDEQDNIYFTKSAVEAIKKSYEDNQVPDDYFLRVFSTQANKGGISFNLEFDWRKAENDKQFLIDEIPIVIDNRSIFYLLGLTIDYTNKNEQSGFIFHGYKE